MKGSVFSGRLVTAVALLSALTVTLLLGYAAWEPGRDVADGRHDLGSNATWLQHGWLGDDGWFARAGKQKSVFRDRERIATLAALLARHRVRYVFPHLCPTDPSGSIAELDDGQAELFLDEFKNFTVLPWVGGVIGKQAFPGSAAWRRSFVASIARLFARHPRLAGVHVNLEPMPSGSKELPLVLRELREALPPGKILSVAIPPLKTLWLPLSDLNWDESYLHQVASGADQVVVMMYDTSMVSEKLYRHVVSLWTRKVLTTSGSAEVLLGVPAYDDAGVGYHDPRVENLVNSLQGIHAGLGSFPVVPANYRGIAIYSEWEMDAREWGLVQAEFLKAAAPG